MRDHSVSKRAKDVMIHALCQWVDRPTLSLSRRLKRYAPGAVGQYLFYAELTFEMGCTTAYTRGTNVVADLTPGSLPDNAVAFVGAVSLRFPCDTIRYEQIAYPLDDGSRSATITPT